MHRTPYQFIILLLLCGVGSSCNRDRVINPFEDNIGTYSAYGALDLGKSTNAIRIRNVSTPFLIDSTIGYEDVNLFFIDPSTDTELQLPDTVINFNGNYTYNYLLRQNLQPSSTYGVKLVFDGGQESSTTITTPAITIADTTPDKASNCRQNLRISFKNVKRPEFINAEVGVLYQGSMHWAPIQTIQTPEFIDGLDEMELQLTVTNLLVDIFPPPPEATINIPPRFWLPTVSCNELDEPTMYIRYIHFGPEWEQFRGTEFLSDMFVDSETIENGIGFIGAIRRDSFSFTFEL
ncbi:MAG: hypothetical protein NXI08_15020 [bacterium]|nr:hypothetical protein [bacterium]